MGLPLFLQFFWDQVTCSVVVWPWKQMKRDTKILQQRPSSYTVSPRVQGIISDTVLYIPAIPTSLQFFLVLPAIRGQPVNRTGSRNIILLCTRQWAKYFKYCIPFNSHKNALM